jgi:hypothetical protein
MAVLAIECRGLDEPFRFRGLDAERRAGSRHIQAVLEQLGPLRSARTDRTERAKPRSWALGLRSGRHDPLMA